MRHAPGFLLLAVAVAACAPPLKPEPYTYPDILALIQSINVADAIDQDEASVIAHAFFVSNISGCGVPAEPRLVDDEWVSNTYIGIGAVPGSPIYIDAKTGHMTWEDVSMSLDELKKIKRKTD